MRLLQLGKRQFVNIDKNERFVAIGFDKDKLQAFVVIEGLGVQLTELTFDEIMSQLKGEDIL